VASSQPGRGSNTPRDTLALRPRQYAQPEVKAFVESLTPDLRSAWHVNDYQGLALPEFVLRLRWYFANTELSDAT
jgi:hypothetical protein